MDFDDYIHKLYVCLDSLTDAFCNGCEKCKTNDEAFEFLYEYYYENIVAYMDFLDTDENGDIMDETLELAERYMFSMSERVLANPFNSWMNKKCVRFFRHFCKKMNEMLFNSEYERLSWEEENAWLGI